MSGKVLIVDDDTEFISLLSDIFRHAGFEVAAELNGRAGLDRLGRESFDLVVSDHRMPGMTGLEFMSALREFDAFTPFIVVSGYLDNNTIRALIRNGVDGVFAKPLNVFSLLKKAQSLIDRGTRMRQSVGGEVGASPGAPAPATGGEGSESLAYACVSHLSRQFMRRVQQHKDFRRILVLNGEPGSPFRAIGEDLCRFAGDSAPQIVTAESFHPRVLADEIAGLPPGEHVTIVVLGAEGLQPEQQLAIVRMSTPVVPPAAPRATVRFVLCLTRDIDDLYEEGRVVEELYFATGSHILTAPPLRSIPEDIPVIAQRILALIDPAKSLEPGALIQLTKHPWSRNVDQLAEVLRLATEVTRGPSIQASDIRAVMEPEPPGIAASQAAVGPSLKRFLQYQRDDYIRAVHLLTGGNVSRAASVLAIPAATVAARTDSISGS